MTRDEYLQILRDNLTTMTDDEKDDVIRYYMEYFIDSGNEQAAMEELGAPQALAGRLCGTGDAYSGDNFKNTYDYHDDIKIEDKKEKKSTGKIVALACTAPLWIPFLIAAISVAFGLALAVVAIVFAIFISFAMFVVAGAACVLVGIAGFAKSAADGMMVLGGGLIAIGFGILLLLLGKQIVKIISQCIRKLMKR